VCVQSAYIANARCMRHPETNLTARLCGEAKNMQILISPRVLAKVEGRIDVEPVCELELKGFHRPVPAYNVLGVRGGSCGQ
jgi:adenylate cyclase